MNATVSFFEYYGFSHSPIFWSSTLNANIVPSTGYPALEIVCLYKPADPTNIEYTLLQNLSRPLDEYMTAMKWRFDLIKKICTINQNFP